MSVQDLNAKESSPSLTVPHFNAIFMRLEDLYAAGDVKRAHCLPLVHNHTIAEHVYGSLVMARELVPLNHAYAATKGLSLSAHAIFDALLLHDAPELVTGDIPAPIKRRSPIIAAALAKLEEEFYEEHGCQAPALNEVEWEIIHACDTLDLGMLCIRERRLGNRTAHLARMFSNVLAYTEESKLSGVLQMRLRLSYAWGEAS